MVVVYVGTGLGILELEKENLDWVFRFLTEDELMLS